MPKYVESNTVLNYKVDFILEGQLVNPTSASITLTKNDGTVVDSIENDDITIVDDATSAVYTIPNSANIKTLDYELRNILIKFVYEGNIYYIKDFYSLINPVNIPVSYDDVRGVFGLREIEDTEIDINSAFFKLSNDVGPDINLNTLISTGSSLIPYILRGVAINAALASCGLIELKIFQSEQSDNTLYKRFQSPDFKSARLEIADEYTNIILALQGVTTNDVVSVSGFIVVTNTDPVTGG